MGIKFVESVKCVQLRELQAEMQAIMNLPEGDELTRRLKDFQLQIYEYIYE